MDYQYIQCYALAKSIKKCRAPAHCNASETFTEILVDKTIIEKIISTSDIDEVIL